MVFLLGGCAAASSPTAYSVQGFMPTPIAYELEILQSVAQAA